MNCVIFGGTGFIGSHFSSYLLDVNLYNHIFLCDIKPIKQELISKALLERVTYLEIDIRNPINCLSLPRDVSLIVNFAAIHREPGHSPKEYFETNLAGAEHVCKWAEEIGCKKIIFASTIAIYGPTDEFKDEDSLPVPTTPYGVSKLLAEKIHLSWLNKDLARRKLIIIRPGVIFGQGEQGNVTRLIRATIKRYFCYINNRSIRKAGGYVKELCCSLHWVMTYQEKNDKPNVLYNFTMEPAPSVEEYVDTACDVAGVKRYVPNLPFFIVFSSSLVLTLLCSVLRIKHPFSPVRVQKLVRGNNIRAGFLKNGGYEYKYTLKEAFEDWKICKSSDWE